MSGKKTCVSCGKQIPSVALVCVFCSAKQPELEGDAAAEAAAAGPTPVIESVMQHHTDPTLVGIRADELAAQRQVLATGAGEATASATGTSEAPGESTATPTSAAPAGASPPSHAANGVAATRPTAAMAAIGVDGAGEPASATANANADAAGAHDATAAADRADAEPGAEPAASDDGPPTPVPDEPLDYDEQSTPDEGSPVPADIPTESLMGDHQPGLRVYVPIEAQPWAGLGRLVMGIGGAVLMALFFCPWHGVSSWQLLETLAGADFVRQLFYLTGGIVLVATAILPLPFVFRAAVGTFVAALPVLLGAGGVLDGWRGVVAALAVVGLPATHLLRSRARSSPSARLLVLAAVAAVALLYLLPQSSVVPIALIFKLIASGSLGYVVLGLFVLIPLVFAGLSLLGVLGRDLTEVGVLLSVLILLWAPATVALRGLMIDDHTQLYVALGLLWASATAALSLAQLLSLAAARAHS